VKVANPDLEETWNSGSHFAFDGYGGSRHPNSIAHGWFQEGTPSEQRPFLCTIDYGEAVAITKFVHYFYVPSVKDYRTDPFLVSTAFESLRIHRSEDATAWALAEQVRHTYLRLGPRSLLSRPVSARHYKIEVTGLVPGAPGMRTYEIESFTGLVIHLPAAATADVRSGESCTVSGYVVGATDPSAFDVRLEASSHIQAPAPVRVDVSGAFRVSFLPLSCGTVLVALDLTTRQGALVDRRTIVLKVTPRVTVSELTARAETVFGRLVNVGTGSVAVQVGVGDQSDSVGPMRPGGESEFRLPVPQKQETFRLCNSG
jgi:hypothetical protein